jgi:hypothetical protein
MSEQNQKAKLKLLTVPQAEADTKESRLYVVNRTNNPQGNINITVVGDDGQKTTVVVPATFIPFDMSNYISKGALLRAPEFRKLVANKLIVLADANEAEKFIESSPRAQREQKRLLSSNANTDDDEFFVEIDDTVRQPKPNVPEQKAQPFILAIIDRENTEDAGDLLAELDSRSGNMTIDDAEYLMSNTKQAAIKQWAADLIRELQE